MKLFWKIFIAVYLSFFAVFFITSYFTLLNQVSRAETHLLEQNRIIGTFIAKELELSYLKSEWPFESLKKLAERDDFLFWWIVKDDGTIYLANNASFMGTGAFDYFPQTKSMIGNENIFVDREKNFGILIEPLQMGKNKWVYLQGFSTTDVLRMKRELIISAALISLAALLILGALLYFMVMHFTKPIGDLSDAMGEIGKGNLDKKIEIKSKDEIGLLALSFNQMLNDLKASRIKLEEYSKGLEKEVAKRTEELEQSKKELEDKVEDMEKFNKLAVGRELKMVELKDRIKELEDKSKEKEQ